MKSHVWRPLFVVFGLVGLILLARLLIVPKDFGVHDRGYMYGFHRLGNEDEWKAMEVRYKTVDYCEGCHPDKVEALGGSFHFGIQCENCHGPAVDHPESPKKLKIDTSRDLCLRCHARLPYPTSGRSQIRGIEDSAHNPGYKCVMCHDAHHPSLEGMR